MFLVISLFILPVFVIYGMGTYYGPGDKNPVNQFFIGNFGAAKMFAKSNRFTAGHMEIECPKGLVLDAKNSIFGVMSNQFQSYIYCTKEAVEEIIEQKGYQDCSKAMDGRKRTIFHETMQVKCHHKKNCTMSIDINNLINPAGHSPSIAKACNEEAYLYVQMPCLYPKGRLTNRKIAGLFLSSLSVFIFLFMLLTLEYVRRVQANRFVEWDVKTITAADYSVEFGISKKQYENFEKNFLDK